jgi:hypothetical protein
MQSLGGYLQKYLGFTRFMICFRVEKGCALSAQVVDRNPGQSTMDHGHGRVARSSAHGARLLQRAGAHRGSA